jgi:short chain dehydrogenase
MDDRNRAERSENLTRRTLLGGAAVGAAALAGGSAAAQPQEDRARPLAGQIALVTGAARGIGRATAVELARHGADIALVDVADPNAIPELPYPLASREDLDEAARLVREEGVRAVTIVADSATWLRCSRPWNARRRSSAG